MERPETIDLICFYYAIPDTQVRALVKAGAMARKR